MEIGPGIGVAGSRCGSFNWDAYWASHYISDLSVSLVSRTSQSVIATIIGTGYDLVHFEYSIDEGQSFTEHGTSADGNYTATGLTAETYYIWRARLSRGSHYGSYSLMAGKESPLLNGCAAYWKLDEEAGNAVDWINEYVLTNYNTATYEAGLVNNCVNLGPANTNKYLWLDNKLGMVYNSSKAISFRVKVLTAPTPGQIQIFASIMINTNPGNYLSVFYINDGGTLKLYMNTTVGGLSAKYTKTLTIGTWYHIVIVQDNENNHNYMYIDGELVLTTDLQVTGDKTALDGGIFIGQLLDNYFAKACIDEFGVFDYAPDLYEIQNLYNGGSGDTPLLPPFDIAQSGVRIMSDMAYSFLALPQAVYDSEYEKTLFGVLHNAGDGNYNQYLIELNHDTGLLSNQLMNVNATVDDHNEPVMVVRESDKRIVCVYRKYAEKQFGIKISTNPCDISSWGSEITIQPCGDTAHYFPQLYEVANGDLYLFFSYIDTWSKKGMVRSTDGGETWSANTELFDASVSWYYLWTCQDPDNKNIIHFVQCPSPNSLFDPAKISHLYFNAGTNTWHESDGTDITASIPFDYDDGTVIESVTDPEQMYYGDIILDSNGYPRVIYTYYDDYTNNPERKYFMYAEWNGVAWSTPHQIHQSMNKNIGEDAEVDVYMPYSNFDKLDPDRIFASKQISDGGRLELYLLIRQASDSFTSVRKSYSFYDQWRVKSSPSVNYNAFRIQKKYYNKYSGAFDQELILDTL